MDVHTLPSFPYVLHNRKTSGPNTLQIPPRPFSTDVNGVDVTTSGNDCHGNSATPVLACVNKLLPNEILADVFALVAGSYSSLETNNGLWKVSLVCRRWKQICDSTPTLWATIRIDSQHAHSFSSASISRLLSTILERSHPCNLHLAITSLPDSIQPNFDHALNVLLAHSQRWETVDLRIRGYVSSLKLPTNAQFPQLRSCTFLAPMAQFNFCSPLAHLITSNSPSLRSLSLSGASLDLPCLDGEGWKALEELTLNVADWGTEIILSVLHATQRLKSCTIIQCAPSPTGLDASHITLSHLQSLELRTRSEALVQAYFERLYCPALRTVAVPCLEDQCNSSARLATLLSNSGQCIIKV